MSSVIIASEPSAVEARTTLLDRLKAEGFREGKPFFIRDRVYAVDRAYVQRCKCGHCRRRSLKCVPLHRGMRYKVVAVCVACHHAEER